MLNDVRLKIRIPLLILTNTGIARLVGFKNTIKILKLFSFDESWANYLINRENSVYYKISKILFNSFKKNLKILDIGTGTGNYLKACKAQVVGIEKSSLNIFLARYFFAKINDILLRHDVEQGIPYADKTFDLVHFNDTFHSLKNKETVLKEVSRVLKQKGTLVIVHSHKSNKYKKLGITGIAVGKMRVLLKKQNYKLILLLPDDIAYLKIIIKGSVATDKDIINSRSKSDAYTIFASKASYFNKSLGLSYKEKKVISR